jgi:TolA-binding protein
MYRYIMLAAFWIASANLFAQDAAAIARAREAEERETRMSTMISRLEEANSIQQKRITELRDDLKEVRRQLVEMENRFRNSQIGAVSQSDVRKIYDKMGEIEKNRQADNNLVKEQFEALKKILDHPPVIVANPTPAASTRNEPRTQRDNPPEDEPPQFTGDYFGYKIKSGDSLTRIIGAFNAKLKEEGKNKAPITLDMVKKANPKLNPNNLPVGREIKIPIPPDR